MSSADHPLEVARTADRARTVAPQIERRRWVRFFLGSTITRYEHELDCARETIALLQWEAEQEASAAKIQALLSEGLQMMRERDEARREAAVWRNAYRGATGTDDDTILSWEADSIEAGTLLGSVAGR